MKEIKDLLGESDRRRDERFIAERAVKKIELEDGQYLSGEEDGAVIRDVSESGLSLLTGVELAKGDKPMVYVNGVEGEVRLKLEVLRKAKKMEGYLFGCKILSVEET